MLIQNNGSSAIPQSAVPNDAPATQTAPVIQIAPVTQTAALATPATPPAATPSVAQLQLAIQNTNQALQDSGKSLTFSVDEATRETVVKLTDTQTNQIIGQFPSKQMLAIAQAIGLMQEQLQQASISRTPIQSVPGLLIKQKA